MIKQYGSMIFHNEAFRGSLKKLYEDERSVAQVLEAITYQLLPELEQYADTVNSHYWLSGLKKVYNSVRPQMMTLSDSLYKHGQMAVDYLDKASVYLKDGQKVEIKQKAYLTLLSNIHEFLKQQVQVVPYNAKGETFEYDTFVQSAIIKKDQIQASVKEQKLALLNKVSEYSELKQYPLETKMFFYSMLRGGGWSLFSTHPIPSDEFLLSSVNSQLLLLSLLNDDEQDKLSISPPNLSTPIPLFRDLHEQVVDDSQLSNTLDWCFLDLAHDRRRKGQYNISLINKLVLVLQFLPEDKNPLRVSLLAQIDLAQQLILSLKNYEVSEKRKAVLAMLLACLYYKRDYDLIHPLKEAVLSAGASDTETLDLLIDSFAKAFRYDASSMPGTMYFILFSLDRFINLEKSKFIELCKAKVADCPFLTEDRREFLYALIAENQAEHVLMIRYQVSLTVAALQHYIHLAFKDLKGLVSTDTNQMQAISARITKLSKASISDIKTKVYTSDLYQKSRQVFWILRCINVAGNESKTSSSKYAKDRLASFFEFVKKEGFMKYAPFVSAGNFGWDKARFDTEEYIPINRIKASKIFDSLFGKDGYLGPTKAALNQLSFPAVYQLIRREVNRLLILVDYKKPTKKLALPDENCSTSLAVFLVMMAYIAKVSYVFDVKGEVDGAKITKQLETLDLYDFEEFFMLYTEYDELYRDMYNTKEKSESNNNTVQPFEDISISGPDRAKHFQLAKRLIDKSAFEKQGVKKLSDIYRPSDSYAAPTKRRTKEIVMSESPKWWIEWENVDLYDEQALIRLYDNSEWMTQQDSELRIKKLQDYVAAFEQALKL